MLVKMRRSVRRVPFVAPAPFGVEVMTLAQLRAIAAPGYLATPQRPTFHLLIFPTAEVATHSVDFERYRLAPGRTLWVRPGQVQLFGDGRPAGDLVLFRSDFLIPNTQAAAVANDRFGPITFTHPPATRLSIDRARRTLRDEYANAADEGQATTVQTKTLRHLLSILILRLSLDAHGTRQNDPSELCTRFRELLERDFATAHNVDHYAQALGYSSRTVSRATQAHAGETPKQAIQDRLALEARRLLAYTDLPISKIATQLGFRDPSNFSTAFAHQTGHTPTAFRAQQRPKRARPPTAGRT